MPENKKARRTIKLRPIGSKKAATDTASTPATGGPDAQTVKLSPVTPAPSSAPAGTPPSAPTVKLSPGGAPAPAAPTVKLSPGGAPAPAAPTVKLSPNTPAPAAVGGDDDRTQPLKRTPQAAATRPGSLIPGLEESFGEGQDATPSAQTKIAPPTPTPTTPIPSAAPTPGAPPVPAPSQEQEEEETVSMSRSELEEDSTQRVEKPPMQDDSTSPIQTSLPGAKQTIKLRPSTSTQPAAPTESQVGAKPAAASTIKLKPKAPAASSEEQEQTAAIAKQTIKLVPNKGASSQAPKPGDPTVKLTESASQAQPKPSDPTVKLTQKSPAIAPGAKTVVLPADGGEAAAEPAAPKTKLSIKKQEPSHQAEMQEGQLAPGGASAAEEADSTDEPSIIFTLVAVFTLIILGFVFIIMAAQYSNHWLGQNINIPVLSDMVK